MRRQLIHKRHIYILASLLGLVLLFIVVNSSLEKQFVSLPSTFGVSYSPEFAKKLGLDPKKTYLEMLTNLGVKHIRLNAYWPEIEPQKNQYDFTELDWYLKEAEKNQAEVILAVGFKLPRWPECRAPQWAGDEENLRQNQLEMVKKVINYYNQNHTITAFQIENEPLLDFGICPPHDQAFFEKEMTEVRKISQKKILITDSGELSLWAQPMRLSDIFGTTLYRKVTNPIIGEIFYPLPPSFYRIKSDLVRKIWAPQNQKTIVAELQAELWAGQEIPQTAIDDQISRFTLKQFQKNVEFAQKTGLGEYYLWGVEWWYYLSEHDHPEYLEYAKSLF